MITLLSLISRLYDEPWMIKKLPEIGLPLKKEDMGNVKELIDKALSSESKAKARDKAREETWKHAGSAAVMIADYMISKYDEVKKKKEEEKPEIKKKAEGKKEGKGEK